MAAAFSVSSPQGEIFGKEVWRFREKVVLLQNVCLPIALMRRTGIIDFSRYTDEYKALTRLGLPITVSQIGMTLQGLCDTIMLGQHAAQDLAAAGFVNSIFIIAILLSIGFSNGSVASMGYLYGGKRWQELMSVFKSGIWANAVLAAVLTLAMLLVYSLLPLLGQDADLLPLMQEYFVILLPSLPILVMTGVFKPFYDSINDTKTSMWIMLAGNVWNVFFNWMFIFGKCGVPEMGIAGAALATATSRVFMLVLYIMAFCMHRRYGQYRALWSQAHASRRYFVQLNKLGWPIGIQMSIETASFAGASLWLGWGGRTWDAVSSLAAYQIMVQVASMIFLFFIGVGGAIAIRVSNANGRHDREAILLSSHGGYQMIAAISLVLTLTVFLLKDSITPVFVSGDDPELLSRVSDIVVACCLPLALYQFGDGMQSAYVSALRGLGDVRPLMLYSFIAYILISMPMSYLFGIIMDGGCPGIFYGFPFGLTTAALLYLMRFRKTMSRY